VGRSRVSRKPDARSGAGFLPGGRRRLPWGRFQVSTPSPIHVPLQQVTPALVNRVHADSLKLFVFTVNTHADIQRMQEMGVDGIFTDFPDRVTKL
jgi:glycerophosphoryl diester phosphodiesterase